MYMGAWLHMFMVKHCRVHWQRFKTNGMKCKWKRSILATMPALSGIMQKSVFTTHIINCLVAHVQLKIINMSLLRNTDLMLHQYSEQTSLVRFLSLAEIKKRKKEKKENLHIFYRDAAVEWQWTCVEAPFCWFIILRKTQHKVHTCLPFHSLPPEKITKEKVYRFWNIFHSFIFLTIYPILG